MAVRIEIKGVNELQKRLERIKDINPELIRAMDQATGVVSGRAKARAPVDTSALRNSIHSKPADAIGKKVVGIVSTICPHAGYVEFGTGRRGGYPYETKLSLKYDQTRAGQVAQPYLYPALLESKPDIHKLVSEDVIKAARR